MFGGDILAKKHTARLDSGFIPSVNFPEQSLRVSAGRHPVVPYVPSRYRNPDYTVLNEEQIWSYLTWKEDLDEGMHVKADLGYVNLLISETLCSDMPPIRRKQRLLALYNYFDDDPALRGDIASAVFDLCVSEGMTLPIIDYGSPVLNDIASAEAFSSPPSFVSAQFIRLFRPGFSEKLTGAFNATMHELDRLLRTEDGKGVVETYGNGTRSFEHRLFPGRPFMNGGNTVMSIPDARIAGRFGDAVRAVCDLVSGKKPKAGILPDYLTPAASVDDPEFRSSPVYRVEEGPYGRMHMLFGYQPLPSDFTKQMRARWEEYSNKACAYVPSGTSRAHYSEMDRAQTAYFRYWKNEIREDRYPETDTGYVWLFANEQISCFRNRAEVYRRLCGMCKAYDFTEHGLLHRLCFEYAVLFGLPPRFATSAHPESVSAVLIEFIKGHDAEVLPSCFATAADVPAPWERAFDDACCKVACDALRQISQMLSEAGTPLETLGGVKTAPFKFAVFSATGLGHALRTTAWADLPKVESGGRLEELLRFLLCESVEWMRTAKGRKEENRTFLFEGIDCGRILESCVSRRMSSGTVRSYEKLDLEAIARAERDLDEVTRIMATGEEPEEEAPAEETSEEPGGWGSFAESLTEAEAEYLRSALGNRLKKKDGSIEDSVNGKALDAIGDTVLEGGSIVEDYREDLEGIL